MGELIRRRRGFSLIELLIVVAIISIIATIAIPILLETRRSSLDEKARQSLRAVLSAQAAFFASEGRYGSLLELVAANPPYLDERFSSGVGQLGQSLEISVELVGGGVGFLATTDNPGGHYDFVADENMEITQL